ncbi:MAG: hypothetical protein AB1775_13130 [Bacteroidota bacterium]
MKKILVFGFIFYCSILSAQSKINSAPFSELNYGIYGGINFGNNSETGGSFLFEFNANLISNLNLNLSLGYSKSYKTEAYTVKSYRTGSINNVQYFWAEQYEVNKKGYDVFPVSVGFQYVFNEQSFIPYILGSLNYKLVDARIYSSPGTTWTYNSFDELPDEFRTKHVEQFPNHSYGLDFGIGVIYPIFSKLSIDLRYYYEIDNETINTHHILIGISL